MTEKSYMAVEDQDVYRKLCRLHLEVCDLTHQWPTEERYEQHGRRERYREIVALWERDFPARYADWHAFYAAGNPYAQEARVQAAVMYHLAPEVAFRLWTLDEAPDAVEKRFQTPLNLPEQLWCRAGAHLE